MMRTVILSGWMMLTLTVGGFVYGQSSYAETVDCTDEDRAIFARYLRATETVKTQPAGHLIRATAQFFIGVPYVAATLEKEPERLIVNLREMDCTTFVENCIALSLTRKEPHPTFDAFCRNLRQLRYRNGTIREYADRLHYFSDWIYENDRQKGLVHDVTAQLGGKPFRVSVSFMSSHPDNYPALKSHPERLPTIRKQEKIISERTTYALLARDSVDRYCQAMHDGDIICFVTRKEGLDISHVGFFFRQNGKAGFIHASLSAKKVIVDAKTLPAYIENSRTTIGLMIVRPQEVVPRGTE